MNEEKRQFEEWAKLELMGHRVLYGRISEHEIAGKGFIRIDIPGGNDAGGDLTQFYAPESVYGISPLTEELCRAVCEEARRGRPISEYDLPDDYRQAMRETRDRRQIEAPEPPCGGLVPGDEEFEEPEELDDDDIPI